MSYETPAGAVGIGSKYYLFKSATNHTDCLISAHGGYFKGCGTFDVPAGVEIIFYGEHGKYLGDPGLKLTRKAAEPVEVLTGGQECTNYVLSKYQQSHGATAVAGRESYETIANELQARTAFFKYQVRGWATAADAGVAADIWRDIQGFRAMSVLTIRNRRIPPMMGYAFLKDAIKQVRKADPAITRFHCSFCRVLAWDAAMDTVFGEGHAETANVRWAA